MSLTTIVEERKIAPRNLTESTALLAQRGSMAAALPATKYAPKLTSFSEQYLEKPIVSGDYSMAISPTACTWRGVPTIDDW